MPEAEQKRGRGRPTVGVRVPLSLRVTPELKDRLDAAAEQSGRSQSQEAEFRLERSFDRSSLVEEVTTLAYGKEIAGALKSVDPKTFTMMLEMIEMCRPNYPEMIKRWRQIIEQGLKGPETTAEQEAKPPRPSVTADHPAGGADE